MLNRKKHRKNFSKIIYRKLPSDYIPIKTIKVTFYALYWVFLSILLFITISIFILFLMGGDNYLQVIIGYSITGFFTFFLGYFGWILAQSTILMMTRKQVRCAHSVLYYIRKHR